MHAHQRWAGVLLALLTGLVISACGSAASGHTAAAKALTATRSPTLAQWTKFTRVHLPLDVAGPRSDGSLVLAADARLFRLTPAGRVQPFASGPGGYHSPGGEEPYIALSPGGSFGRGTVYALRLRAGRGVVAISSAGTVRRFASLSVPGLIDGIAFDQTGGFGHRLLVTINDGARTAVEAIDSHGAVTTITRHAPRVEGGIAVAPPSFGRLAGDLIASSEYSGKVWAVTPQGHSELVATSGLPHGGDIGVESEAFVPGDPHLAAFLADRLTPGNRHPGDDFVLRIGPGALQSVGVHPGDLLVATEGGALTEDIAPARNGYRVRLIARGPAIAHAEGHIAFG